MSRVVDQYWADESEMREMFADQKKRIAELEAENRTLVHAINEMRQQMQSIGDVAAAFRRMPITDMAKAHLERQ